MMQPEKPAPTTPNDCPAVDTAFIVLVSFFVGALVIASVLAVKILSVWVIVVPAGVIAYSLTFTVTDTISEIWGKRAANRVVLAGFVTLSAVLVLVWVALKLPAAPFWQGQSAFNAVLGQNLRIIVASLTAYIFSQLHDVWAFHFWREKTRGKHLWLRNNFSTWVSQFIDTVIFILIAFAGIMDWGYLVGMIGGQYLAKIIIAAFDTPITYLLVHLLRKNRPALPVS